jgi:ribA/ribD-fused uncharacterized protein
MQPSVADLIERGPVKFLPFWGHRAERDGSAGRGCLSQWWPASFTVNEQAFATAEHYMMWHKAMLFGDADAAGAIAEAAHPHRAKALGRQVRGFDQAIWEAERYRIVVTGSVAKFSQHQDLRTYLLSTGNRILVEASPLDLVWGIGASADDPRVEDPARWPGLNLLGFALIQARAELRSPTGTAEPQ